MGKYSKGILFSKMCLLGGKDESKHPISNGRYSKEKGTSK